MAGRNISVNCKYITVLQDSDDESYLDTLTYWDYCVIRVYNEIKEVTSWGWYQTRLQNEVQYVFVTLFPEGGNRSSTRNVAFVILFERLPMKNVQTVDNSKCKC